MRFKTYLDSTQLLGLGLMAGQSNGDNKQEKQTQ
jgi:hypothetical protein